MELLKKTRKAYNFLIQYIFLEIIRYEEKQIC